jgi:DNA mismatch repair protein MutL
MAYDTISRSWFCVLNNPRDHGYTGSPQEICEKLRSSNTPDPSGVFDEILHTVACKAAIKAGWDTQRSELEKIASAVLSGQVLYCPHGRPVSSVITRKDLDRLFKRIV